MPNHEPAKKTVIDWQAGVDEQIWRRVNQEVLPKVIAAVRRYFGPANVSASVNDAAMSAVLKLLQMPPEKKSRLETLDDLENWLIRVAWRKYNDHRKKAHSERRRPFPVGRDGEVLLPGPDVPDPADLVSAIVDPFFSKLNEMLGDEERLVLQGRRAGQATRDIASEQGWTTAEVENKMKRIMRKARQLRLEDSGD